VQEDPNEPFLKKIFEENKNIIITGANFVINALPYNRWAKILSLGGVLLSELSERRRNDFVNSLEDVFYKNSWRNLSLQERIEKIDRVVSGFSGAKKISAVQNLDTQIRELYEKSRRFKPIKDKQDMIAMLDTDIKILSDITVNAVVKAIGLERAFISVVVKNINLIRNSLSESLEGRKIFNFPMY